MAWYVVCMNPKVAVKVIKFPLAVGREAIGANSVVFFDVPAGATVVVERPRIIEHDNSEK